MSENWMYFEQIISFLNCFYIKLAYPINDNMNYEVNNHMFNNFKCSSNMAVCNSDPPPLKKKKKKLQFCFCSFFV